MAGLAYDRSRSHAAIFFFNPSERLNEITVRLGALHAVHYRVTFPRFGAVRASYPMSHVYAGDASSLPVASASGAKAGLVLPAGAYRISWREEDIADTMRSVVVADREVTLGTVALPRSAKAQLYGKVAPPLRGLVDMQGQPVPNKAQATPWRLVYFWSVDCGPCIAQGIPKLLDFARRHAGEPVEIVVVHERESILEPRDWKTVHARTEQLAHSVWKSEPGFPMLLDTTGETTRAWGIAQVPTEFVIGPNGRVVPDGALETVEQALKANAGGTASPGTSSHASE